MVGLKYHYFSLPAQFSQLTLPYLILHGANDQVINKQTNHVIYIFGLEQFQQWWGMIQLRTVFRHKSKCAYFLKHIRRCEFSETCSSDLFSLWQWSIAQGSQQCRQDPEGQKSCTLALTNINKEHTSQVVEGALHNLYAEKESIRNEAIKDTVDWVVARIWDNEADKENAIICSTGWIG